MSTVVATNINTDALVGNTSANAITVRGEGSATTSLQQGLCKLSVKYNMSGVIQGTSLNVSSITDTATGRLEKNFTNSFSNANYIFSATCSDTLGGSNKATVVNQDNSSTVSSSQTRAGMVAGDNGNIYTDAEFCSVNLFGDLA